MARPRSLSKVRVDEEGRLIIPEKLRLQWRIRPGDIYIVRAGNRGIRYARVRNPIEGLARQAIAEYRAGKTRGLREFADDENVSLNET